MKTLVIYISKMLLWIVTFWGVGVLLTTLVFCILFDMHPSNPDYSLNTFIMHTIGKMLVIPAFFLSKYITNE